MAGYSGTPLPRKLGLGPNRRFGVVRPPEAFADVLGALPGGVSMEVIGPGGPNVQTKTRKKTGKPAETKPAAQAVERPFDVIVCFVRSLREVEVDLPLLQKRLAQAGGLWMAWPKRTSGIPTDAGENQIRALGLAAGLVDNKVCAIDEIWSGLRFVIRLADRAPAPGARAVRKVRGSGPE
jgi:hypothetical protein